MRATEIYITLGNLETVYNFSGSFSEGPMETGLAMSKPKKMKLYWLRYEMRRDGEKSFGYENILESLYCGKAEKAARLVHTTRL